MHQELSLPVIERGCLRLPIAGAESSPSRLNTSLYPDPKQENRLERATKPAIWRVSGTARSSMISNSASCGRLAMDYRRSLISEIFSISG
jgi:hypothetical protein